MKAETLLLPKQKGKKRNRLGAFFLLCLSLRLYFSSQQTPSVQSHDLPGKLRADLSYIWLPLIAHSSTQYTHIRHSAGAMLLPVPS